MRGERRASFSSILLGGRDNLPKSLSLYPYPSPSLSSELTDQQDETIHLHDHGDVTQYMKKKLEPQS